MRPTFPRALICATCLLFASIPAGVMAEDLKDISDPPKAARPEAPLKAFPALVEASRIAADPARGGMEAARKKLSPVGQRAVVGDDLRFEVVEDPALHAATHAAIREHGGTLIRTARDRVDARIPLERFVDLEPALPEGAFVEPSGFGQFALADMGQGPAIMSDGPYRDIGFDGTGITIAIIDVGFFDLTDSETSGDAPAGATRINLSVLSFEAESDGDHGRFVTETIYDHAPGATYLIYKVDNQTGAAAAIDAAAAQNVDIISMSLGWYPDWVDGNSASAMAANDAAAQGILVFNSVGNSAQAHWEDYSVDPDNDGYITWGPGNDEVLQVTVPADSSVSFRLSFDRSGGNHDYDFFIYNADATVLLDGSTNPGESYESVSYENENNFDVIVQLVIEWVAGPGTLLEVYSGFGTQMDQYVVSGSSPLTPSDASHPNVLSVGAVEQAAYGSGVGSSGINATYSSQGPTNGFQLVPDICAPTSTSGSFFGSFIGTSCSCPHAAGMAAVLWSADPFVPAAGIRNLILEYASAKDWGGNGPDYIYGAGGMNLPELEDCNFNGWPDAFDIVGGISDDVNENFTPDECDPSGFAFGVLSPDMPPLGQIILIATLDPDALPTSPDPEVSGFDMVFGFDPAILQVDTIEPAPALVDLLGGTPAEFTMDTAPGAVGVRCNFGNDPATGAPLGHMIGKSTPVLAVFCSVVPGASGPSTGGPLEVTFGFEDQPTGLIVPAIQRVRAVDGGGVPYEFSPIFVTSSETFPTVDLAYHGYSVVAGSGDVETVDAQVPSSMLVPVDPMAPGSSFSVRWRARQVFTGPQETASLSAALSVDPAVLTVVGASPSFAVAALAPDFFLTDVGIDGVGIGCTWSAAGTTTVPLGTQGMEIAWIDLETTAAAVPLPGNSISTVIEFAAPASVPLATNVVEGPGFEETPHLTDGQVKLVSTALPADQFRRGDVDGGGAVDIADAIQVLSHLFGGAPVPACADAADANDDGSLDIADPIGILGYLFQGAAPLPTPGPTVCGEDPTADALDCASGGGC